MELTEQEASETSLPACTSLKFIQICMWYIHMVMDFITVVLVTLHTCARGKVTLLGVIDRS